MPPSVDGTRPENGGLVGNGQVQIHGHTLHILDDDALEIVSLDAQKPVPCPTQIESHDERDSVSMRPGSVQVRCVISVDVTALEPGRYGIRLNLLSHVFESVFVIQ